MKLATRFISFGNVVVSNTGGEGDYSPALIGQSVTFTPFQFSPVLFPNPVKPLWSFAKNGLTYSFDATGQLAGSPWRDTHKLTLEGPGIAYITGFEPTPGFWVISANTAGTTASFSASASTVPEPATLLLLGLGLLGIGTSARIRIKK